MAEHVADLDAALAEDGENVVLRRTGVTDLTVRAFVRGVSPEQLAAGVKQDNSNVIISSTEIIEAGWPGTVSDTEDTRVPKLSDKLVIASRVRQIEFVAPIYVAGELVRMDIRVTG